MAEINQFLSPEAQKEVQNYIASLEVIASKYKDIATASLQLEKAKQEEAKTDSLLIKNKQQLEVLAQKKIKTQSDEQKASEKLTKAIEKENSEYEKLKRNQSDAVKKAREMATAYGVNSQAAKTAAAEAKKYSDQLKKVNDTTGAPATNNVGKYFQAIMKGAGTLGLVVGGAQLAQKALGILGSFFTASEKGAELLERKMAGFSAATNILRGEIIKLGDSMFGGENLNKTTQWGDIWTNTLKVLVSTANFIPAVRDWFDKTQKSMNDAAKAAEEYTRIQQELDDIETGLIVPRAEANRQLVKARELYMDETLSIEERMAFLKESIRLEDDAAYWEIKNQEDRIKYIELVNSERKKAGQLRDEDIKKLEQEKAKAINLDTESTLRTNKNQKAINVLIKEVLDIEKKNNDEILKNRPKDLETIGKIQIHSEKSILDIKEESINKQKKLNQELYDQNNSLIELNAYNVEQAEKRKQEARQKALDMSIQMVGMLFDYQQVILEAEMASIERYYETRINAASNAGEDTQALEREYEIKRAEMDIKIAKSKRNQALLDIAIATAVNTTKAGLEPWLIPFLITLGALQAAVVLAQPLPEVPAFFAGTESSPDTFIAGDRGREIGITKDGKTFLTPDKSTLYSGMPGTKIIPNQLSELVLKDIGTTTIDRKLDKVIAAIEKNQTSVFIDKSLSRSINLKHIRSKHGRN